MTLKTLLTCALLAACLGLQAGEAAGARSSSSEGATVAFSNLSDGDVIPPVYIARFTISGMGIAPAGAQIENTGHFHLLIDLNELPDFDQPLPANEHLLHFGKGQTQVQLELTEGEHTLQLLLADHAHVPHDPPVMSKAITIVVSAEAPPQTDS
jgi:hypothetical protein